MPPALARYISRHEPRASWRTHLKSTAGAALGVTLVGSASAWSGLPLLIAPLTGLAIVWHRSTPRIAYPQWHWLKP